MSKILQPGQHPDADQLNAFVEHVLPLDEQQRTLAHLAACADCRAIVYLAQPASLDQVAHARPIATRKPWFSGWKVVWPAAAALACLVILSVNLRNTGTSKREAASVATAHLQQTAPPLPTVPPPAQTPPPKPAAAPVLKSQAAVASPAATSSAATATTTGNINRSLDGPPETRTMTAIANSAPGVTSDAASSRQSMRGMMSGTTFQSATPAPGAPSMAGPLTAAPSPRAGASTNNAIRSQLRSANTGAMPQSNLSAMAAQGTASQPFQAAPPPQTVAAASPSVVPASSSQTMASADTVAVQRKDNALSTVLSGAAIGSFESSKSLMLQRQPVLPSHLPSLSTISNDRQKLAIDTGGTLFRSEDAGVTWHPVPAQWIGRAVRVSLTESPTKQMAAKGATPLPASAPAAKRAETVPAQSAVFELTTDKGDLWISDDGQIWRRK
jgi:hypothetical protein